MRRERKPYSPSGTGHKVQVAKYSPSLTDRLAGNSKEAVAALVRKIKEALDSAARRRCV